jgi:hypothetical protein
MKFMLLICDGGDSPESAAVPDEADGMSIEDWVAEMDGRGIRLQGDALRPPTDATTVRIRHGELLLVDGPFAETKEVLCGFDIVECDDLDEAIEVASKHPMARSGMIEVRPFRQD